MAMSHDRCNHPRTPAGRAACRKAQADRTAAIQAHVDDIVGAPPIVRRNQPGEFGPWGPEGRPERSAKAMKFTVEPRTTKRTPRRASVDLKRPGSRITSIAHMADVPHVFSAAIKVAWDLDWDVVVGAVFKDDHRLVTIRGVAGDVYLAWSSANPNGLQRVSFRPAKSSITYTETLNDAMRMACGEES